MRIPLKLQTLNWKTDTSLHLGRFPMLCTIPDFPFTEWGGPPKPKSLPTASEAPLTSSQAHPAPFEALFGLCQALTASFQASAGVLYDCLSLNPETLQIPPSTLRTRTDGWKDRKMYGQKGRCTYGWTNRNCPPLFHL